MVGSAFALVLRDLRREGMRGLADELEAIKARRMKKWMSLEFPCGGGHGEFVSRRGCT
jgi:hypothetical protein